jgi:hypothetical protein
MSNTHASDWTRGYSSQEFEAQLAEIDRLYATADANIPTFATSSTGRADSGTLSRNWKGSLLPLALFLAIAVCLSGVVITLNFDHIVGLLGWLLLGWLGGW